MYKTKAFHNQKVYKKDWTESFTFVVPNVSPYDAADIKAPNKTKIFKV